MISAFKNNNIKCYAFETDKEDKPFLCPSCRDEVILKKGLCRIHHFSHKVKSYCSFSDGESEIHRRIKMEMFNALKQYGGYEKLSIEEYLYDSIPDVFVKYKNSSIAIEVQKSSISLEDIKRRTLNYFKKGIYVLWVVPFKESLLKNQYSPKEWEKWLHSLYFGRVYYALDNGHILPVHYSPYYLYKEHYYNYTENQDYGGYEYASERFRTPIIGNELLLTSDFRRNHRKSFGNIGGRGFVPECKILLDTTPNWWKGNKK